MTTQCYKYCSWLLMMLFLAVFLTAATGTAQVFDPSCTVTANGRTAVVNPDGSFSIRNIPAGPDLIRVTAFCMVEGVPLYGASEQSYQITANQTVTLDGVPLSPHPPLSVESIRAVAETPTLTAIGQTTPITVTATMSDATQMDASLRTDGTTYRTSNPAIATVTEDGLVTAVGRGTAMITASNMGATAVARVNVSPGDALTVVEGFTLLADGSPVSGATALIFVQGQSDATGADGRFQIPQVATELGPIRVKVIARSGSNLLIGESISVDPVPGAITDAGIITLEVAGADQDNDGLPDAIEAALGLLPNDPDSDNDGILDGDEDRDGDGLTNCEEIVFGTDPAKVDTDGDRLDDLDELFYLTDPLNVDTDADGFIDGEEVEFNSDALDFVSLPVDPGGNFGEAFVQFFSVFNLAAPVANYGEAFSEMFSTFNLAVPTPFIGEAFGEMLSVENAAPPPPNFPVMEANAPFFSVYNQGDPVP